MPRWKFRAFFKFWFFSNSVLKGWYISKFGACNKAASSQSFSVRLLLLYFPVTNFKVSFQKEKLRALRLLSTVTLWTSSVAFIDVIIGICQDLATLSQSHEISKSFVIVNANAFVLSLCTSLYLSLSSCCLCQTSSLWLVFGSLGNLDICCFWLFILQKKLSYSCYDMFQILNRWSLATLQSVL